MDKKRFPDYTFNELLLQEDFQQWVKQPDTALDEYWQQWLEYYPAKKDWMNTAGALLNAFHFEVEELPEEEQRALWLSIQANKVSTPEKNTGIYHMSGWKAVWKIAVVFLGLALLGSVVFWANKTFGTRSVATDYGKMQTIILPDSTTVTLNAHSSIKYAKRWRKDKSREVWMTGEAYFRVRHLNHDPHNVTPGQRFIVHAGEVNVEALGTVFDIKARREKIAVGLNSGIVRVSVGSDDEQARLLSPGEVVAYDRGTGKLVTVQEGASALSAWTENKMMLTDAPVSTIVQLLEDNYGYKVKVEDTAILNRKLNGVMLIEDDTDILFVLKHVLDIEVVKNGTELIFKDNKK